MANGIVNNGRARRAARKKLSEERNAYRATLSARKQLERLDARLEGTNVGAKRERARLAKLIENT
jgi:hypothetical protein